MSAQLLAAAATAMPSAPLRPGVWSSVHYSEESGDVNGLEVIVPDASAATVDVTLCEGGCAARQTVPIKRAFSGFTFDYALGFTDQDGRPAIRNLQARFDGDVLVVLWLHVDRVDVLRRRARRLNLSGEASTRAKQNPRLDPAHRGT